MSPLPAFDHNFVLPPHEGDPRNPLQVSPYKCSITDFCNHFNTSPVRLNLLINLLEFRVRVYSYNLPDPFQWISGSFIENIEADRQRPPQDIDILTFFTNPPPNIIQQIQTHFKEFTSSRLSKETYSLDHYPINYGLKPHTTVEYVRYWLQLFNHTRNGIWKGMIRLELNDLKEDQNILATLKSQLA